MKGVRTSTSTRPWESLSDPAATVRSIKSSVPAIPQTEECQ
jgi:hypothetical protein